MSLSGRSLVTEDRPGKPREIEEDISSLLYISVSRVLLRINIDCYDFSQRIENCNNE